MQILSQNVAEAKFGDSIDQFRQKMGNNFAYINMEKKNTQVYYHFSVKTDNKIKQANASFAGGLTVTTDNGKIRGESLLVHLGIDDDIGKRLAAILCLNLAYDALGKPIPALDKDQQAEFNAYYKAVNDAMSGQPGHINYPGYSNQLIFSQTNDHHFLFVMNPGTVVKR